METWFTSDTHFAHSNIIKYSNRPFRNVREMDDMLINNINEFVAPQDTLYHLGDFTFARNEQAVKDYRLAINCRNIIFIYGNHDHEIRRSERLQRLFKSLHELLEIRIGKQEIILCHYAMRVWNKSHRGSYHLHGHSHGSLDDIPESLSFDCGVDCTDYYPINIDYIHSRMQSKKYQPIDHHGV